jgi:hypothetical protein
MHLLGLLSLQAEQYDAAVEWISRAIRQTPRPEFLVSLSSTLRHQGRHEEALQVLDKAVQLRPTDAELWKSLGEMLIEQRRLPDALLSFQHALKLNPGHWHAANHCGNILHSTGRIEEALSYFDLCDRLRPNHFSTLHKRAVCVCSLSGLEVALPEIRRAQAIKPSEATIHNDIGMVLQSRGQDDLALTWFDQALKLRPTFSDALHSKAVSLARVHRFDEAFAAYRGLKLLDPNDALADLGQAHLQLLAGHYEAGWAGREVRWRLPSSYPKLPQPMWLGHEALEDKTILIGADEGLGDTVQFARYVPMLAARGARVILVVQDQLYTLLQNFPGATQCLPMSATTLPAFEMHCPIMSLPFAFGTTLDTIPAPVSYLPPPTESRIRAWDQRLGPRTNFRIGLVWSGNPKHKNDHNRSLTLRAMAQLLNVDATFVSLQKDPRPADKAALLELGGIIDFTTELTDFSETAALVSCLDLVITVDTSVAHLSAALGRRTWIVLPYTPDYRWLLDRDDSPWYPTVRLFRQSADRDYTPVLAQVREELVKLISTDRPSPNEWDAAESRAAQLFQSGRLDEAVAGFTRCLELRPDYAPTLQMRALALFGLNRFAEALNDMRCAHTLDTGNADICNNAGVILQRLGRYEESLSWFDRVIAREPDYPAAYTNKASSLTHLSRHGEAFAVYEQLLRVHPDNLEAQWALALLNLLTGNFEVGWAGREVRWRMPNLPVFKFKFSQPIWLGNEAIAGKTILIHVDEGLGDTIQFVRYVPMVAALGARVILVVADALHAFLSKMPDVTECVPLSNKSLPAFDLYCPIGSLPFAFATTLETIPSKTPYLPAAPRARVQFFEGRLGRHDKLRVGLVWAGNPKHKNDSNRSIALRTLAPMLDLDATFVSLQKDVRTEDKSWLAEHHVIDLADDLADFMDTAALVSCLDLVVSVDTSVAHLAGALGVPTWIVLPHIPDYRWLLDRDNSPWYPTVKLFRQGADRDYAPVVDRVRGALIEQTKNRAGVAV